MFVQLHRLIVHSINCKHARSGDTVAGVGVAAAGHTTQLTPAAPRLADVLLGQDAAILFSTHPQFTQINTINYTHCCFLIAVVSADV